MLEPKTPDEVKDYGVEWADQLGEATISSSDWIVQSGMTEDEADIDGTATVIRVSGGTAGQEYVLVNQITTSAGETLERAIQIRVRTAAKVAGY